MKLFTLSMLAMIFSFASFAITPISPSSGGLCVGAYLNLADSLAPGGTWTSSNPAVATITGSTSGYLYGVSAGVVTITYTTSSGSAYGTYTVDPAPANITGGPTQFCVGGGGTMMDATSGGTWSSSSPGVVSIDPLTGVTSGVSSGYASIYYNVGACSVMVMDTVDGTTTHPIEGPTTVCAGSSITLTDSLGTGGSWSSSTPGVATISVTGVVTGVAAGTTTISLAFSGVCGTVYSTYVVTVTTGSVGPVSGPATVTVGGTGSYGASPSGGTWAISPTSVATIDASGNVTGVSTGTATITYTATSCGTSMSATFVVTVTALDGISGNVIFSSPYYGNVKVWLIKYYGAPSYDLEASDSTTVYCAGTSVYYQFTGLASDSFRVKAAVPDSTGSTTGFIPTYHSSFFYWHDANVINHVSGTSDINENITMLTGSGTTGPGFISGSVLTGANKGTSGTTPVVGLHMVALTSTGAVAQMGYTDATGTYTLGNLPVGTYTVFPDSLNYLTTPYTSITLTSGVPTFTGGSFIQHTISKTITPGTEVIKNVSSVASISAYPNPTTGRLNILWNENAAENANMIVTDITGRQVYTSTLMLSNGSGVSAIDLSALNNGLYIISIKTATLNYNNKIEIQH